MSNTPHAQLLAIVEVEQDSRVQCQQPGCGHTVWKAVHVVLEEDTTMVLGSTCFAKRYGGLNALGAASYWAGSSRKLTAEERELLLSNMRELLARFEAEKAFAIAKLRELRQRMAERTRLATAPVVPQAAAEAPRPSTWTPRPGPWPWMKQMSSMAYFKLSDGTGWVRVQRRDGQQMIVPLPTFDGWDEALPPMVGTADSEHQAYCVPDIARAVAYLRSRATRELVSGVWAEIRAAASSQ